MCFLVWDHMVKRIENKKIMFKQSFRTKNQQKKRYDQRIKTKKLNFGQYVFLKNITNNFGKLTPRWKKLIIVNGYGGNHNASYKLKKLTGKKMKTPYHGDHLRLFVFRTGYFRPRNETPFEILNTIRFNRKRNTE